MIVTILQNILLAFIGLSGGIAVAGGVFAFISILGILPRLAGKLRLASYIYHLETIIALGGIAGNIFTVFKVPVPLGIPGLLVFGLFAGIFVGCLAMALAETLKVIPVLCQRTNLRVGLPYLILAMSLGKGLGSLMQLFFNHP